MAYSPMIEQYLSVKKNYPDTILFYRVGDFYEMFFDDAIVASRELELVLTGKDAGQPERIPMCGVPYHAMDSYIAKLVKKGHKVAVCEQMEDPAKAKGLVVRDVIRVHTPGTEIESDLLEDGKNNFLGAVYVNKDGAGACFVDVSTGEIHAVEIEKKDCEDKLIDLIARYLPAEILVNEYMENLKKCNDFLSRRLALYTNRLSERCFDIEPATRKIEKQFNKTVEELSLLDKPNAIRATGTALSYLSDVQKGDLRNIEELLVDGEEKYMSLSATTRGDLELTQNSSTHEKKGSLLWAIDKTQTPMGRRMLRTWVEQPLIDVVKIQNRQTAVTEMFENTALRDELTELLKSINDLERITARIVYGTATPKELRTLCCSIDVLPQIKQLLNQSKSKMLKSIYNDIDTLDDVWQLIDSSLIDDPPLSIRDGGVIKSGFNSELDTLRDLINGGKGSLKKIELEEQEKTGIKKLRIGYNKVFGYYIEVLNTYKDLVPKEYIRKQTLTNCERYITDDLKKLESQVLGAQERISTLENEIFVQVRAKVGDAQSRLRCTSTAIATLDTIYSLARTAVEDNYECPTVDNSGDIFIEDGRHPVVEKFLNDTPFVPNDTSLDNTTRTMIITGPNMAGKSTYMRQTAIIVLMAQMGSFVPAKKAKIGVVDAIFTRVGASDNLSRGESTFMVEMNEVSQILKHATKNSLLILDEIGRGTSTFDGMSIAKAVLEYVTDTKKIGAKTLFATHYHELSEMEGVIDGVKNYNTSVKKRGDDITFLRKIVPGRASGSFGIEVAKLAGLPNTVISRAKEIHTEIEREGVKVTADDRDDTYEDDLQLSFSKSPSLEVAQKILSLDIDNLSPMESLTKMYELKAMLQK